MVLVGDSLVTVGTRRGDDVQNFFRFLVVIVYPKRKKAGDEKFGQFRLEGNVVETSRASLQGISETPNYFVQTLWLLVKGIMVEHNLSQDPQCTGYMTLWCL